MSGMTNRGCAVALLLAAATCARADGPQSLQQAIASSKPLLDLRLRYEQVEQAPLAEDAQALTLRARMGIETGKAWSTSLLAELNGLVAFETGYRPDNASTYHSQYPVVADPHELVLNRLALVNTAIPKTTVTLGRQRINLDDQRFIGASAWRQDEQTFDALRVVSQPLPHLMVDVSYLDRVHRVFGQASPQGTYKGSGTLLNLAVPTAVGRITGFAYLLDLDAITAFPGLTAAQATPLNPARVSTSTYGARFAGEHALGAAKLGYIASWARQTPRGSNPLSFSNDYALGEVSLRAGGLGLALGDERMTGNGTIGFSTPLGTVHPFDGWADKFLATPANGLDNRYVRAGWQWSKVLGVDAVSVTAIERGFRATHVSADYGDETDLQLAAKRKRLTASFFYADYRAAAGTPTTVARDTRKIWLQLEYAR